MAWRKLTWEARPGYNACYMPCLRRQVTTDLEFKLVESVVEAGEGGMEVRNKARTGICLSALRCLKFYRGGLAEDVNIGRQITAGEDSAACATNLRVSVFCSGN